MEVDGASPSSYPLVYTYGGEVDVTVEAFPAEGYTFLYWRGCVNSSENPLTVTVDIGKSITAYFTYTGKLSGTIRGHIWNDLNKDGVQEYLTSMKYVPGMEVELYREDGTLAATTVAETGFYSFTDVEFGRYYIFFDVPSPYVFTLEGQGDEDMDSDADGTGKTDVFAVGEDSTSTYLDAGVYKTDSNHFEVSVSEAHALAAANPDIVVVDVREPEEFCEGHIENALNMPWESGYLIENYGDLPPDSDILLVCRSGHRSRHAAEFLDSVGYESVYVYNLETGMLDWDGGVVSCYEGEPVLFYQHIATQGAYNTEIGIVNTSDDQTVEGTFRGYDQQGGFVAESGLVRLNPHARLAVSVEDYFKNADSIRYIVFESENTVYDSAVGYTRYFHPGGHTSAVPAKRVASAEDVHIPHFASNDIWETGIALLNPGSQDRQLEIEFDDMQRKTILLPAFGHKAFTIGSLFGGMGRLEKGPGSARIKNSAGILAMEILGRSDQNSFGAVSLSESAANVLSYPLVADDAPWWSGIVAYNTSEFPCDLTVKPFTAQGEALEEKTATLAKHGKYIGSKESLGLPPETAHVQIEGTRKITGFVLIGKGRRMGGSEFVGLGRRAGVLPRLEKTGWTSIVLVNHGNEPVEVTLNAYTDSGTEVESKKLNLKAHEQQTVDPLKFFATDIREASYIDFSATGDVGALQFNGSGDERTLDLLPAL